MIFIFLCGKIEREIKKILRLFAEEMLYQGKVCLTFSCVCLWQMGCNMAINAINMSWSSSFRDWGYKGCSSGQAIRWTFFKSVSSDHILKAIWEVSWEILPAFQRNPVKTQPINGRVWHILMVLNIIY